MASKAPKQHVINNLAPVSRGGALKQTLYRKEYDAIAERLVKQTGATVSEIANYLGVSIVTIYHWQSRFPSFKASLQIGEEVANNRVALSLYNQAVGYYVDDEEIKIVNGEVLRVKIKRWIPPNASAAIFWAKAKMNWTDREQLELPPPATDEAQIIDGIPDESPRQRARRIAMVLIQGGLKETG